MPLRWHIGLSGALVLLACGIITFFFHYAVTAAANLQGMLIAILWISMLGIWALAAFVTIKNYTSTKYILTDQTLVVRKKGWFGSGTEKLYRYDMIMSVHSTSRGHGSYGSIEMAIRYQEPAVVLHGVVNPDEQARRIKELVNAAKA